MFLPHTVQKVSRFWRMSSAISATLFLVIVLAACGGGTTVTPTPTTTVQFTNIPLKLPAAAYNGQLIGPMPAGSIVNLGVSFKVNSDVLPKQQGKIPTGQNIDGSKIANQYGISDATYQKIKSFLGIEDVTLTLNKLHSYMTLKAKASTVEEIFQTQFQIYKQDGRQYYVPAANKPPRLPNAVAGYIIAVTGLESYYTLSPGIASQAQHSMIAAPTSRKSKSAADCTVTAPDTLLPSQIATAYGYQPFLRHGFNGTGVTVNIVELGGVSGPDLENYFSCVNFPTNHFSYQDIIKPAAQPDPGGTEEATLDIEMVAGLAPGANIVDYEAAIPNPSNSNLTLDSEFQLLNGDLQAIIDNNISGDTGVNVVSISYGAPEAAVDPNVVNAIDQSIQTLVNVENMTVFVSTGDCGAFGTHELNKLAVQYPSTDPWATAVGGTELAVSQQGQRANEVVWGNPHPSGTVCNHNDWGGGGGVSTLFKIPSWQKGRGVTNRYTTGARQVPDVSAVADNVPIYADGQWVAVGGTSAAAPIWASSIAVLEQALVTNTKHYVYGPDLFYIVADQAPNSRSYFDVVQGNNLYYSATANWDNASGWGSPNLLNFYNSVVALLK